MQGNAIAYLMMFGWIPAVIYLFITYPPQRALITSFIGAWLFLPVTVLVLPGIPDYSKMSATCYGVLLCTLLFDAQRLTTFRFSLLDIPMLLWCVSPFLSSMTNDLGAYDGISATLDQTVTWGFPYLLGRIYINNLSGMRQLAIGCFIGGLVYMPFCLYESRTFSSLHRTIYGFATFDNIAQAFRYGGYRPSVFMQHGLMVGMWMMLASLMGIVLWRTKIVKRVWNFSVSVWVVLLLITFVLVRSTGAYMLLAFALGMLFISKWTRNSLLVWAVVAGIVAYLYLGVSGGFPGKEILAALGQVFEPDRIQSLEFRFQNEEVLSARARLHMWFGWGGFGRNRIFNEMGEDISVTDSLWIIVFGVNGAFGILTIFSTLLLPVLAFTIRFPAQLWLHPAVAPAAALAMGLTMYVLDCVLNAMVNPVFALACGGLVSVILRPLPKELRRLV